MDIRKVLTSIAALSVAACSAGSEPATSDGTSTPTTGEAPTQKPVFSQRSVNDLMHFMFTTDDTPEVLAMRQELKADWRAFLANHYSLTADQAAGIAAMSEEKADSIGKQMLALRQQKQVPQVNVALPETFLKTRDGRRVSLADYTKAVGTTDDVAVVPVSAACCDQAEAEAVTRTAPGSTLVPMDCGCW